jgi:succinylarginine dihydrolase
MSAREWQFDGLVGPTHNYAGLATGNLAAAHNAGMVSNPRMAALQGLDKMRTVHNLGVPQAFFPPHYRPLVSELKRLGFSGSLGQILDAAYTQAPAMLAALYSSSFMWAANVATVTPASDSADGKTHLTPANLMSHYHRSIEAPFSYHMLNKIFHNNKLFSIHNPLPSVDSMADEGAANHMRLKNNTTKESLNIFVYGKSHEMTFQSTRHPARQHRAASEAIIRLHRLDPAGVLLLQQSPQVIDKGVFHNDVIAMSAGRLMVVHEEAFIPEHQQQLRSAVASQPELQLVELSSREVSVDDAVSTYLFNSQLLILPDGKTVMLAPAECSNHAGIRGCIERLITQGLLQEAHYLDVRESMRNGGGPACLRLRIVLDAKQEQSLHEGIVFTDEKYLQLSAWVKTHYRDRLHFSDLRDPALVTELDAAYRALEEIIGMPGLYDPWRSV